jgi:nucleotide-binding universal stress UspA family protein
LRAGYAREEWQETMSIFPTKILLATDGSEDSELAATTAVGLARSTGSELHVAYVLVLPPASTHDPYSFDTEVRERAEERAQARLDEQLKKVENMGGTVAGSYLRAGGAAEEIVELAEEIGAGLVVLGSRGLGKIRRLLMGSVSHSVIRHAHCPVMVVRRKPVVFPARILLATDGSEEATLAAQTTADLARRTGSELHVVTVGAEYPLYELPDYPARFEEVLREQRREAREVLDEQVKRIEESGGTVNEVHLREGRADEEIAVLGDDLDADLIVTGSRGVSGLRRALLGSVSDSVVRHAHCPVLVVRRER